MEPGRVGEELEDTMVVVEGLVVEVVEEDRVILMIRMPSSLQVILLLRVW
jgi:hypothetical protein